MITKKEIKKAVIIELIILLGIFINLLQKRKGKNDFKSF